MKVQSTAQQLYLTTVKIESYYTDGRVGTGAGSLLNDLDKQQDTRDRHKERADAKKQKRAEKKLIPKKKY